MVGGGQTNFDDIKNWAEPAPTANPVPPPPGFVLFALRAGCLALARRRLWAAEAKAASPRPGRQTLRTG